MSYTSWWDGGFGPELVSVTPPRATISEGSSLTQQSLGKAPGLLRADGTWTGYRWLDAVPSRENVAAWNGNLGIKSALLPGVDIDVLDADLADAIEQITRDILGDAPCRVGKAPKRLLMYRSDVPLPKRRLEWFTDGVRHAVEVLGTGNQYLVAGEHATAGVPYVWDFEPVLLGRNFLTVVTATQIDALFAAIGAYLSIFGIVIGESCEDATERVDVPQDQLLGELAAIRAAVAAIPNEYTDRESYIRIGVAIKAALADWPGEAFELWAEWCAKWTGGENLLDTLDADWRRMKPPFAIGAQFLYDLAAKHDPSRVLDKFTVEEAPSPLGDIPESPLSVTSDGSVKFSDAWIVSRFVDAHGDEVRYCPKLGGWLYWDGSRWAADDVGLVASMMARIARDANEEVADHALSPSDARSLGRWCNAQRTVSNALQYASHHQRLVARIEAFDTDPWVLNTPAGVIHLRTGNVTTHDPKWMLTKSTLVAPSCAPPTQWLAFLAEVTGNDPALESYLKRLFGYALTGVTDEEMLAFFWGSGGNGKGTLLKTIFKILGGYAETAAMDTFTASEFERHPTDLAALAGARLVIAQETQEGRSWDEARIKTLTGSDPVKARFMRQDFFTYQPQFKLVFAGNHRPNLQSPDAAMLRRFHLIPFNVTPKIVDIHLKEKLIAEYPQILGWMIEGCQEWLRSGLAAPSVVEQSTEEYFRDSDPFGRWIADRCALDPMVKTLSNDLFTDYRNWCLSESEECMTQNAMGRALKKRGLIGCRMPTVGRERGFQGITLASASVDVRAQMLSGEPIPVQATLH